MADLRERLRRIEAAEPPDLWAGIESRAREESPRWTRTSDRSLHSGSRARSSAVGSRRDSSLRRSSRSRASWPGGRSGDASLDRCRPGRTAPCRTAGSGAPTRRSATRSATRASGTPRTSSTGGRTRRTPASGSRRSVRSTGQRRARGMGLPARGRESGARSTRCSQQETDPEAADVLVEEELVVDGHRAVRLEYETLNDVVAETGLHYRVPDRARRRDDADRAHDGDARSGGRVRGEQGRRRSRRRHPDVPPGAPWTLRRRAAPAACIGGISYDP